ncbi:glycosyltransferase [Frankia sp. AiPs1]|uniref:glycosyltransferase n=1 Tax=Frankia sp. AiPs1 TaxID=573493 RepID=UPI002044AD57|nr:glycosyltransferase [Frankia sp. AiPs1]MCM3924896.1 glycosyltransferase [Frankia sp. AiPs1]
MNRASGPVLVDCAGAQMGGALRFLTELDGFLAPRPGAGVRLIGRGRRVAPSWLARRERPGRYRRTVALNNVGYLATRSERWVLLRNALHFLTPAEVRALPGGLPADIARAVPVVRLLARRADVVVVPASSMADRVLTALPGLADRLVVRPHPLSPPPARPGERIRGAILCPVLFASFKPMGRLLRLADTAAAMVTEQTGEPLSIVVTATGAEAREQGLADCPSLRFVGRLTPTALRGHQRRAGALLYPTTAESFGYPLAEARLAGVPVIARGTGHNAEVAGPVLVPYRDESADDLATAMHATLTLTPPPEPTNPFDPVDYFTWLLDAQVPAL